MLCYIDLPIALVRKGSKILFLEKGMPLLSFFPPFNVRKTSYHLIIKRLDPFPLLSLRRQSFEVVFSSFVAKWHKLFCFSMSVKGCFFSPSVKYTRQKTW